MPQFMSLIEPVAGRRNRVKFFLQALLTPNMSKAKSIAVSR
jgi:hypothetical protein